MYMKKGKENKSAKKGTKMMIKASGRVPCKCGGGKK